MTAAPASPLLAPSSDRLYPTLTPAQLARIAPHGRPRQVAQGEVLVHAGETAARIFVVLAGRIDVIRPSATEEVVVSFSPGMFTGEATMLSGRRGLAQVRAGMDGEVIEVARDDLLALIQTDSELSAILMRAFILRRVELISRGVSDVVVLGSSHCQGTLRIREFLTKNGHPYTMLDLDRDASSQELLDRFHVTAADIPVVITCGEVVLRNRAFATAGIASREVGAHPLSHPPLSRLRTGDALRPYAPRRTRTPSLLIRSQALYPVELWARLVPQRLTACGREPCRSGANRGAKPSAAQSLQPDP